ncbi:uncharacterized protein LOC135079987 isoform X2 [Ostrinia nubilalis]|uniref:uncharacterized protein LOC135079987 isoform X2 n=1 Tax=Ostrinia nubilalis TaxID=29057 RepID=UPI0030823D96
MSLSSKDHKENFRLLDLSSDEESEDLHLEIIPSRKKKISRKERNRGSAPKAPEPNIGAEVRCALQWALRGTLILWLLMLTWICAALYDQVTVMSREVAKVTTSSVSVGDALQSCHSAAKELQANASDLSIRLTKLEYEYQELTKRVDKAAEEVSKVSEKLAAEPMLADTPRRLADLQRTVAYFGSQISGFEESLNQARKQATTAVSGVDEVKTMLHTLEVRANETIANVTDNGKRDGELKEQVASLNTTLVGKVEALETRIELINKPTSTAAPTTAATSTTSSTTSSSTSTTTAAPGPPAKPFVLQSREH